MYIFIYKYVYNPEIVQKQFKIDEFSFTIFFYLLA